VNVLDLFSGIGGFSLGLERAGMRTVAFCEIDPYARAVLRKHWPDVPCYEDVRAVTADRLRADGVVVDVVCGGFPCTDISVAGQRAGLAGEQSGLWAEFARIVCELRPRYVIVENSQSLCVRGMGEIISDLVNAGYDAEWAGIPAAAIGACHLRAREWILAYSVGIGDRLQAQTILPGWIAPEYSGWWASEPRLARVAHGVSARVDRLRCLGNAVVPQVVEVIGRAIMAAEMQFCAAPNALVTEQPATNFNEISSLLVDGLSAPSNREP
jgi:DNA (cytosine-5)-methyltransferase 1